MNFLLNRLKIDVFNSIQLKHFAAIANLRKTLKKMPIDQQHIEEAQRQRLKIKEKSTKYAPGTANLQILGSGATGAPAAVYLFTDQSRYLFNCGEGTQRLAHEHKTKLARLEHIFTTRTSWNRIGGLPGLCLTVQDCGVPFLTLHGPPGLDELFKAMKPFVVLRDLKVTSANYSLGDTYEDAVMTLKYIPIKKEQDVEVNSMEVEESEESSEDDGVDYYANETRSSSFNNNRTRLELPKVKTRRSEQSVMAYICKLKPRPGTLSLQKCVQKGVQPGPELGKLKNGFDITLPNGVVVKSSDVTAPCDPGSVFMFIDIPSEKYLKDFEENQKHFAPYQCEATEESDKATVVMHFTPADIMSHPTYKAFMDKFPSSTNHIALNDTNSFSGYISSHRIQCQLNQLDDEIFPLLNDANNSYDDSVETDKQQSTSMTHFHLRPQKGLDRSMEAASRPSEYLAETENLANFKESVSLLREQLKGNRAQTHSAEEAEDYPKIVFLGTGSCIPNKTRNVSGILVHTNSDSSILLDCGEGTVGQIIRFYGKEKAASVFRSIKAIYVSHLHADHHIGLIGILQKRRQILGDEASNLLLVAPKQISHWLKFYDGRIEELRREFTLIKNGDLISNPLDDQRLHDMGIQSLGTCLVKHCPHSFGVSVRLISKNEENIKITYSGDTMPCKDLIELGKDSTVLIHEATMEDELIDEAKCKMHSTVSQAIEQGKKMNAKFILLTHFSQRYAKIPRIDDNLDKNIGIAFDNMQVTLKDLPNLHLLYPSLKSMFMEHFELMEDRANKRSYKKQRLQSRETSPSK